VPTLETPMSPGGSQASAGEGLSPCNIGIGIGIGDLTNHHYVQRPVGASHDGGSEAECGLGARTGLMRVTGTTRGDDEAAAN